MKVNIVTWNPPGWIFEGIAHRIMKYAAKHHPDMKIGLSAKPQPDIDIYHYMNPAACQNARHHKIEKSVVSAWEFNERKDGPQDRTYERRNLTLHFAGRVAVECQYYADLLRKKETALVRKVKPVIIRPGIDPEKFKLRYRKPKKFTIGIVGRWYEGGRKGDATRRALIQAIVKTKKDWRFKYVGWDWEREVLWAKEQGLDVEYLGFEQQGDWEKYEEIYGDMSCLLITSKEEGGPIPLIEALASGVPVVSTPVGLANELIISAYNGYMTKFVNEQRDADVDEIMLALNSLEDGQHTTRQKIKKTVTGLTWDKFCEDYINLYKELFEETKHYFNWLSPQHHRQQIDDMNVGAMQNLYPLWAKNFMANQSAVMHHRGVACYYKKFRDIPAILVAAGPSLNKHLKLLRAMKGRAVIIAFDAVVPTLTKAKIQPDFIFNLDPNQRQVDCLKDYDTRESVLIANSMCHPDFWRMHNGRLCFYTNFNTRDPFLANASRFIGPKGLIPCGFLTTASAINFAGGLRCNPIVFLGQDLSYDTRGNFQGPGYAKGMPEEKVKFQDMTKCRNLDVMPNLGGGQTVSHPTFTGFYIWALNEFKQIDADLINCSERGILWGFRGIETMPFREFCEKHTMGYPIKEIIDREYNSSIKFDIAMGQGQGDLIFRTKYVYEGGD